MVDVNTSAPSPDDTVSTHQREVADAIRSELYAGGTTAHVAKMTSLLRTFRRDRNDTVAQHAVVSALSTAHVEVQGVSGPAGGASKIGRSSLVTLSPKQHDQPIAQTSIRVESWNFNDGRLTRSRGAADPDAPGIAWIDVSYSGSSVAPQQLSGVLKQIRPRAKVSSEMLKNLLAADDRPAVTTFGNERSRIRGMSVVAVVSAQQAGSAGEVPPLDVIVQPIELLVGPDWLVTCWQAPYVRTTVAADRGTTEDRRQLLHEPFLARVEQEFLEPGAPGSATAGDLGLAFVRGVVDTYDASLRLMHAWTSQWRRLHASGAGTSSSHPIAELSGMVSELAAAASALLNARHDTRDRTWLAGLSELRSFEGGQPVKSQVEKLEEHLRRTQDNAEKLEERVSRDLQAAALRSNERTQNFIQVVTGVLLIPTLVVGFFGANTALPGQGSWTGFALMVLLMATSITAGLAAYVRTQRRYR